MIVKINGRLFEHFNEVGMSTSLDSMASTFYIKARFNPDNEFHREVFRPLAFNSVEFFDNDQKLLFTGVTLNSSLSSTKSRALQELSGYSKSGILENSTIPRSSYPLEKNNVSLRDISSQLLGEFGLSFTVSSLVEQDMSLQYSTAVAEPDESIKSFINKLAVQRNIIIGHNEKGDLVFFRVNPNATPKMFINPENCLTMNFSVSGQDMYSEITVLRQPSKDNPTLKPIDSSINPLVSTKKVLTKILSSGTETDTKKAADNILAKQLKNLRFTCTFEKIVDLNPGDVVEVQNPEIQLYNRTKLIVSAKSTIKNTTSETSTIELVLPEVFTGQTPVNIYDV